MAGATIRIEVEDKAVKSALARMQKRAADLTPAMDEIGSMLTASVLNRFETGTGPGGQAWPPSIRAGKTGGQTLVDTGRLRDSITHIAGRDFVEVGTNVIYAAIQQLGGRAGRGLAANIPARPYLDVDAGDKAEIGKILKDHIGGLR